MVRRLEVRRRCIGGGKMLRLCWRSMACYNRGATLDDALEWKKRALEMLRHRRDCIRDVQVRGLEEVGVSAMHREEL
jgi:hypothetical protein